MKYKSLKVPVMWLILFTIFMGPLALASWFYAHPQRVLAMSSINHGYLFQPPINIDNIDIQTTDNRQAWDHTQLQGRWWIVFYTPNTNVDKQWQHGLYQMRQVRLALGKDQDRVNRILVVGENQLKAELSNITQRGYAGTVLATVGSKQWSQQVAMQIKKNYDLGQGSFYIIDPHGNLILAYPAAVTPRHLFEDLTRLLRASSIG